MQGKITQKSQILGITNTKIDLKGSIIHSRDRKLPTKQIQGLR
jgi:hypothetical protein